MSTSGIRITFGENAAASTGTTAQSFPGGKCMFMAEATWGGGSAKVQVESPNGTWLDTDPSSTLSANGMKVLSLPPGRVRAVLATGSAFYAYLVSIKE